MWLLALLLLAIFVYRYWALGFHQCRYGYPNVETLKDVVDKFTSNNVCCVVDDGRRLFLCMHCHYQIPLDTMWTDIDYMDEVSSCVVA